MPISPPQPVCSTLLPAFFSHICADGSSGQMRMYTWTQSTPNRDGDLSNDVVAHEQTHGTTNRMTGGGTGRCLQTTEAGGMVRPS